MAKHGLNGADRVWLTGRRLDLATILVGALLGVALAFYLEALDPALLAGPLEDYLVAPFISAANAGISCL